MQFIVMEPKKILNGLKVFPTLLTEDQDVAVKAGQEVRQKLKDKGYDSWAARVKVRGISCTEAYKFHAKLFLEYGHYLDSTSNGNSFYAEQLIAWGNKLNNLP